MRLQCSYPGESNPRNCHGLRRLHRERKRLHAIGVLPDPTGNRRPQSEVHADIFRLERALVAALTTELHLAVENAVLVVRTWKFQAK